MRKMVLLLLLVSLAALGLSGCTGVAAPVSNGLIFTNVDGPVAATMSDNYSKVENHPAAQSGAHFRR
ncbi:MAG: hypothetical protein R2861_13765 [Desulfobacterales bacterium]